MKRNKKYYQKIYDLKSWQGFHVNQLSYIRNLIIILSTAVLGFSIKLLLDCSVTSRLDIILVKISCGLLFGSITSGILMSILESINYRKKYKISRMLETKNEFEKLPDDILKIQNFCSKLESTNRILFYTELLLFTITIGILAFLIV